MSDIRLERVDGGVNVEDSGCEGVFIPDCELERVAKFLRAHSPQQRVRELTAERQKRWVASHNASHNASSNAKVKGPNDEHRRLALEAGVDCDVEWAKYRDWQANAKVKHKNLTSGFNNWLRKAVEFRPKVDKRERVSIAIWGDRAPGVNRMKTVNEMFADKPALETTCERIS